MARADLGSSLCWPVRRTLSPRVSYPSSADPTPFWQLPHSLPLDRSLPPSQPASRAARSRAPRDEGFWVPRRLARFRKDPPFSLLPPPRTFFLVSRLVPLACSLLVPTPHGSLHQLHDNPTRAEDLGRRSNHRSSPPFPFVRRQGLGEGCPGYKPLTQAH